MGQGIAEVLTFAIGVSVSAMAIIAVILILMLFSQRAAVNGPLFLCGWALALAVVSTIVYLLADQGDVDTSSGGLRYRLVGQDRVRRDLSAARGAAVAEPAGSGR